MKNITQLAIGRKYGLLTIQEETGRDKWKQIAIDFHELNLTTSFEEAVAWLGKVVDG